MDLRSALAKFEWAKYHREALEADISRWANRYGRPPVRFRREFKPQDQTIIFYVVGVRPLRAAWSLQLGDALNNYRSALDHLAWQLVRNGRKPRPKKPERVQFPIVATTRADFFKSARSDRLPGVSQRLLRKLSRFQPYQSRVGKRLELLLLANLVRTDKHREMNLTLLRPGDYRITASPPTVRARRIPGVVIPKPFQPQAEALRVYVWPWTEPEPDVRVDFEASSRIAVQHGTGFDARVLPPIWLVQSVREIETLVGEILGEFIGL